MHFKKSSAVISYNGRCFDIPYLNNRLLLGNRLFMIVETPLDFDWDSAMARLATLPRQQEWEDYMAIFQDCNEGDTADEKWQMMERIFYLYDK